MKNNYYSDVIKFDDDSIYRIKLPNKIPPELYDELYSKGILSKDKLVKGCYYKGKARRAKVALWDGDKFIYMRYKFGVYFPDEINHLSDDNGFDLFLPLYQVEPTELETIKY